MSEKTKALHLNIDEKSYALVKSYCQENGLKINAWATRVLLNAIVKSANGLKESTTQSNINQGGEDEFYDRIR